MAKRRFQVNMALLFGIFATVVTSASAQMGMPFFAGGVPGMAQMQSIVMQRHQARTLLYREALDVLKKNPAAADVPRCSEENPMIGEVCIRAPDLAVMPPAQAASAQVPPPAATRKIALLFGNNAYVSPIPALETPIADVQDIGRVLQDRYGYDVRLVRDAKKADMISALNQVGSEAKLGDSVLIFYAGHGYLMESNQMGYWIPVDGSTKSPANWVSNTDISKFLKNIAAHQLILVSDSCFSGSLTREQKISDALRSRDAGQIRAKRSVLVMSSGDEEPVSDEGKEGHSIFAWSLIKSLQSADALTPGIQLFKTVKSEVVKDFSQQPQYGAVLAAGHMDGGEYLFEVIVKNTGSPKASNPQNSAAPKD